MPVRYPPDNQYPRTTNRDPRNPRVVSYVESRPSFVRRVLRRLFSAPVIIPLVFISAIVLGILDLLLDGLFTAHRQPARRRSLHAHGRHLRCAKTTAR